jgi:hypothetical protein
LNTPQNNHDRRSQRRRIEDESPADTPAITRLVSTAIESAIAAAHVTQSQIKEIHLHTQPTDVAFVTLPCPADPLPPLPYMSQCMSADGTVVDGKIVGFAGL